MIQSVSFTSAAFEDFAEANLWFLVSALAKKQKIKIGNKIFRNLKKICLYEQNVFLFKIEKQCLT